MEAARYRDSRPKDQAPALLRTAGVQLITLAEHYGMPEDESIDDVTWLTDSAERGEVAFMKEPTR